MFLSHRAKVCLDAALIATYQIVTNLSILFTSLASLILLFSFTLVVSHSLSLCQIIVQQHSSGPRG